MLRSPLEPMLALLVGLSAAPGLAQTEESPPQARPDARLNPILTDRSLEESMLEKTTLPGADGLLLPTVAPNISQIAPNEHADAAWFSFADGSGGRAPGVLLPEGTFLVRRLGEIVRLSTGGLAFLPATQSGAEPEPAMPLMPCEVYGRLASLMAGTERGLWMSITGEVFQYHGRNYLLPSAFATEAFAPTPPPNADEQGSPGVVPAQPADAPTGDPRIDALVRDLEAQRAERKGIDTAFTADEGAVAGAGPRIEGRMLLGRRGRMVRSAAGGWVITLDNDTDTSGLALPSRLRLLPCRAVGAMERQAEARGEAWVFEVSGNLYRMGESVYLLPRLFVSLPQDELKALQ